MKIKELCNLLEIQNEVIEKAIECEKCIDFKVMEQDIEKMMHPECWEGAIRGLECLLGSDEDGMKIFINKCSS